MSLLELRRKMSRRRMRFNRQDYSKFKKVGQSWRKPRGCHSKQREKIGPMNVVKIGFRGPREVRGLHPCGLEEVLVFNPKQLDSVKGKAVRIGASVGMRKRVEIIQKAEKMKLKVLNKAKVEKPKAKSKVEEVKKNEPKSSKKAGK